MSRKNRLDKTGLETEVEIEKEVEQEETVENTTPITEWQTFDQFWAACVKNGTPAIKSACIAHLKAIKCWEDSSKWVDGARHFGIPVEK